MPPLINYLLILPGFRTLDNRVKLLQTGQYRPTQQGEAYDQGYFYSATISDIRRVELEFRIGFLSDFAKGGPSRTFHGECRAAYCALWEKMTVGGKKRWRALREESAIYRVRLRFG
jgi:hypothetical protein